MEFLVGNIVPERSGKYPFGIKFSKLCTGTLNNRQNYILQFSNPEQKLKPGPNC